MKTLMYILILLTTSSMQPVATQPRCGSAQHCYALLNRLRNFSPHERENFAKEMKEFFLNYAQDMLNLLHSAATGLLTEALHDDVNVSFDAKGIANELQHKTEMLLAKVFDCRDGVDWIKQIKNSNKMEFDVDEFDCAEIIEKSLKNNHNNVYPGKVNRWLDSFDTTSTDDDQKRDELGQLVLKIQKQLLDNNKSNDELKSLYQVMRDQLTSLLATIDDILSDGPHIPSLQKTKRTIINLLNETTRMSSTIEENDKTIKEILDQITRLSVYSYSDKLDILVEILVHKLPKINSNLKNLNEKSQSIARTLSKS